MNTGRASIGKNKQPVPIRIACSTKRIGLTAGASGIFDHSSSRRHSNENVDKKSELQKLRGAAIRKYFVQNWQEVWFFPSYEEVPGVRGFMGTGPIFFVSINPSFGTYPSKPDLFYYRNLKKQGFQNAHLTDVFKVKCKNENVKALLENRNLLREMEEILKKEIAIVRPKVIVGVGLSYEKLYRHIFGKYNVTLLTIPHYAPQFNSASKQKQFSERLRMVRETLESTVP